MVQPDQGIRLYSTARRWQGPKANDEKWAEYQKVDTWRRDTYIKDGGYAMMAGLADDSSTSSAITDACVKALNKLLETRAK